jgi:hypothetical protein
MTVGARQRFSVFNLNRAFRYQKTSSKSSLYQARIRDLHQEINWLRWSDPSEEAKKHTIEEQLGQGRMLAARDGFARGMVDRIGTLDELIQSIKPPRSPMLEPWASMIDDDLDADEGMYVNPAIRKMRYH